MSVHLYVVQVGNRTKVGVTYDLRGRGDDLAPVLALFGEQPERAAA